MGAVHAQVELRNAAEPSLQPMIVNALVDTGAAQLCVPEHVRVQLRLKEVYRREVTVADGRRLEVAYVGPVEIKFANRGCMVGAFVLGDEVLLGAIPMEDMDLVISPLDGQVIPNPRSPNLPSAIVK